MNIGFILWFLTPIVAESIRYERKEYNDIFQTSSDCNTFNHTFYHVEGWCSCMYGFTFVGDKCMTIGDCGEQPTNDFPNGINNVIKNVEVMDYNYNHKFFWNKAFSDDIKALLLSSTVDKEEKKKKLKGLILKINLMNEFAEPKCTIVKLFGSNQYPTRLSITTTTNQPQTSESSSSTTSTKATGITSQTTTTTETDLVSDERPVESQPAKMFSTQTTIIITATAVFSCILVVVTIILIRHRRLKRHPNGSKNIESPFNPEVSSNSSAPMDPNFSSPALSRHSFETIISATSEDDNIYNVPGEVIKDKNYQLNNKELPEQTSIEYDEPEVDYDEVEPEYEELEPEYRELEPELEKWQSKANCLDRKKFNQPKKMHRDKIRPVVPRKPTRLQTVEVHSNEGLETEYYSEPIGSSTDLSPNNIEELYAIVDKTQKGN